MAARGDLGLDARVDAKLDQALVKVDACRLANGEVAGWVGGKEGREGAGKGRGGARKGGGGSGEEEEGRQGGVDNELNGSADGHRVGEYKS